VAVDLAILEKHGCSAEAWKKLFEIPEKPTKKKKSEKDVPDDPLKDVKERIRSRETNGRDYNFANFETIYALDLIWDTPFRQVSPTLLAGIVGRYKTTDETLNALKAFGFNLTDVLVDTGRKDPKTKQPIKAVSVPAFFNVLVPLVRAYLNIRRAKIVNDRNRRPLIPYQAAINNEKTRVKTQVLSNRIQAMADQYDYLETLNQNVFQMLLYPYSLMFTMEGWHYQDQLRSTGGKEEVFTEREGLRYHSPHPSRTYWDQSYPMKTFNSGSGCRWGGHWKVLRYREVKKMEGFYNLDRISIGNIGWWTGAGATNFFNSVYNSCVMAVPSLGATPPGDREEELIRGIYNDSYDDKSVMFVEHREIVNPKADGLGSYPYDTWARFVSAGDGTIIYAEPLGYNPIICWKDNGDEKRIQDASLALQLVPFQDQLSNLLTQYIYAVKQNLANITLIDKNIFKKSADGSGEYAELKKIKNLGENWYRGLNLVEMDTKELLRAQYSAPQAFYSHRFPQMDTNAILQAMKVVIDMAERVLQFSSQEVAQAATHEQTKAEVNIISGTTTNVLQYTGIPVDGAIKAWGEQLYDAWMNYGDDDFEAQVPADTPLTKEQLKDMGIDLLDEPTNREDQLRVRVKKSAVALLSFAFVPDNQSRVTDTEAATAMATFVRDLMSNPITGAAVGPEQAISLANQIAKMAGLRLEAKLRNTGAMPQQEAQQVLEQVLATVLPEVKKGMAGVLDQLAGVEKKVDTIYQMANIPPPTNGAPGPIQTPSAPPGPQAPILPGPERMLPA
jgi:hypothetical protein